MDKLMELVQLNSKEVVKIEHFFTEHFERKVWRIGFYEEPDIKLENAGAAAIKRLLRLLAGVKKSHKVLCLGAHGINLGYLLLERFGCYVTVFCDEDITGEQSHVAMVEGDDAEKMTIERGTMSLLPYASNSFDAVISLETLAFIEDKEGALRQIADVLKPKGRMLFTSLFLTDPAPFTKIGSSATSLIGIDQYVRLVANSDLDQVLNRDMTSHLIRHYEALSGFMDDHQGEATTMLGKSLLGKFNKWLMTYTAQLKSDDLGWGVFLFQKSNV